MTMKKKILTTLSVVLILGMAALGILAYLTSEDSDVNVMTLGEVKIEQFEKERTFDANGNVTGMRDFSQAKPLYPAVVTNGSGNAAWAPNSAVDIYYKDYLGDEYPGGNGTWQNLNNTLDKFVFVKNTGKSDAYYRTIILMEADKTGFKNELGQGLIHTNINGHSNFTWNPANGDVNDQTLTVEIDGVKYYVLVATYNAVLAPQEISRPSLLQIGMDQIANNEQSTQFGDTYDILVLSQAVQAEGFDNANGALTAGFGEVTAANVESWFSGTNIPTVKSEQGVNYVADGDVVTVTPAGGYKLVRGVISDGIGQESKVVVKEGMTTLSNRALCKNKIFKSVELPQSLTTIEEGAFQESGFIEIEIPENVTYIGKTAFGACPDLEKIVIKAKNVTLANYVGRDSGKLKEVYIYSNSVTFESGSMYFTNKQTGDASNITFYVSNQTVADALYNSSSATRSFGMLIKSIDGATTYYDTRK